MNTTTKKRISIVLFIIGIIALVAGAVFLIVRLVAKPAVADGEYLVTVGEWVEQDAPSVVWNFTEPGKGTLTTNAHTNDYDFVWGIDDGKLQIRTDWLYTLDNEYSYTLDQSSNTLTLKNGDEEIQFIPLDD